MKVLIVAYYFPPAGGGGVQRVLKLCQHLPELGFEVHVLAPDDPRWSARDEALAKQIPASTVVHRARYRGPSHEQTPAARLAEATGARRIAVHAALTGRRLLLPDPEVAWLPDAVRAGTRAIYRNGIDVILTTSPPSSAHVIGAVLKRSTKRRWVADFRDSWLANPHRRYERRSVRAKSAVEERIARAALKRVDAASAVTPFIRDEVASLVPSGVPIEVVANGCDFDTFDGLQHVPGPRLTIVHAGSFFGERSPRPFLTALRALLERRPDLRELIEARFLGELRPSDLDWALGLGLGDALRLEGFRPHAEALRSMKAADALLLLIPRAGGRGRSVLSGKVYEYLAAERPILALVPPDGDAAALIEATGAGWVADPDDPRAIEAALEQLADSWQAGTLEARALTADWRERLDRRARVAELAALLRPPEGAR